MGDRANVLVLDQGRTEDDPPRALFIYSHWGGYGLPEAVRQGLIRGADRWQDGQYLGRILFDAVKGGDVEGTTGFGLGVSLGDNEHPILVIDPGASVGIAFEDAVRAHDYAPQATWSYDEFVALGSDDEPLTWEKLMAEAEPVYPPPTEDALG